jgi:hypothetical protein
MIYDFHYCRRDTGSLLTRYRQVFCGYCSTGTDLHLNEEDYMNYQNMIERRIRPVTKYTDIRRISFHYHSPEFDKAGIKIARLEVDPI